MCDAGAPHRLYSGSLIHCGNSSLWNENEFEANLLNLTEPNLDRINSKAEVRKAERDILLAA